MIRIVDFVDNANILFEAIRCKRPFINYVRVPGKGSWRNLYILLLSGVLVKLILT